MKRKVVFFDTLAKTVSKYTKLSVKLRLYQNQFLLIFLQPLERRKLPMREYETAQYNKASTDHMKKVNR